MLILDFNLRKKMKISEHFVYSGAVVLMVTFIINGLPIYDWNNNKNLHGNQVELLNETPVILTSKHSRFLGIILIPCT